MAVGSQGREPQQRLPARPPIGPRRLLSAASRAAVKSMSKWHRVLPVHSGGAAYAAPSTATEGGAQYSAPCCAPTHPSAESELSSSHDNSDSHVARRTAWTLHSIEDDVVA